MTEAVKLKDEQESSGGGSSMPMSGPFQKIAEYPRRWKLFFHDVRSEMSKVVWPSRQDVISTTMVVTITVAFFGLFFLGTDSLFGAMFSWVLNRFK
ncbi:MAG: preprotein translocase subunit SecE [Candidatus Acidiferrales bacterium]